MRLLITRPQADAERSAAALRARGHEIVCAPMLHIENVPNAQVPARAFDALMLSSLNALRALQALSLPPMLLTRPLFLVGARSAHAAQVFGFTDIRSPAADAESLAGMLLEAFREQTVRILYLAGEDRTRDFADLAALGIVVDILVVYRARPAMSLPDEACAALRTGTLDGVLHYSERTAAAFLASARASGVEQQALTATHYCISAAVAAPLQAAGARSIRFVDRPDEESLFRLLQPRS